ARAARQRLDVEYHVAELAVAAGLFLVAAALGRALADRLAIADARLVRGDRDAVASLQAFGRDAQMHLALAPQDHVAGFVVVDDSDRGVLVGQLGERRA